MSTAAAHLPAPLLPAAAPLKPRWRGVTHHVAFYAALLGCAVLLKTVAGSPIFTGAPIYGVTLITLFGISAAYHRPMWGAKARAFMKRLDHASIFVFIAGSYTPMCLLAMPQPQGKYLLVAAWTFACLGVVHSVFLVHVFRTLNAVLFVLMGCLAVPFLGDLWLGMGALGACLMALGGVIYILGAVIYARRWPNPNPAVFGYHEVFHLMVIAGCSLHYVALSLLVSQALSPV